VRNNSHVGSALIWGRDFYAEIIPGASHIILALTLLNSNRHGEKQDKHLAMFPLELPYRLIKMFSFVGDTVLDPFVGSGTASLAAKILHRNSKQ